MGTERDNYFDKLKYNSLLLAMLQNIRTCSNIFEQTADIKESEMKKRDLEAELEKYGWWLKREGGNHEVWTNGEIDEYVPRHREINELLAKKILKTAKAGKKKK